MQAMEKIRPATSDKHGLFRVWDMQDQEYKDPSQFWVDGDMVLRLHGDTSRDPQTRWAQERYIGFQDSQNKDLYLGMSSTPKALIMPVTTPSGPACLKSNSLTAIWCWNPKIR